MAGVALNYTNAHSSTHPSRPNYLRLFAGMDDSRTSDGCVCTTMTNPFGNPCDGTDIACDDPTKAKPVTDVATLYAGLRDDGLANTNFIYWGEGLLDGGNTDPFVCGNMDYVQKHNPAAYFKDPRTDECKTTVWTGWPQSSPPPRADGSGAGAGRLF